MIYTFLVIISWYIIEKHVSCQLQVICIQNPLGKVWQSSKHLIKRFSLACQTQQKTNKLTYITYSYILNHYGACVIAVISKTFNYFQQYSIYLCSFIGQNDGCVLFQNPFISRTEIPLILCGIHARIIEPYVIIQIWNILHVDNYVMKSNHNIINQVLTVCNFLYPITEEIQS